MDGNTMYWLFTTAPQAIAQRFLAQRFLTPLCTKNGGTIVMQTGKNFNVPTNALLDITNGKIIRSNDF